MRKLLTLGLLIALSFTCFSQTIDQRIFKDTRIINLQSVETLKKSKLDFRIGHKFGDLAGTSGGWRTFYGLENAADILIGLDFGITDKFMFGLSRTKGAGPLKQNITGQIKYALLRQDSETGKPLSMTVHALCSFSTMPKSNSENSLAFFAKTIHRASYHAQFIVAKKFANRLSLQFNAAWTYRNIVASDDTNDLVSIGGSLKYQLSKSFGVIFEGAFPFSELRTTDLGYFPATGIGLEWETGGGHIFQVNFTNATGIIETDFIPYTRSSWGDGGFRLGFTISRLFNI